MDVACNGKEVVEKFTQAPDQYDLIFMDIQMSELDGMEATGAIRNWEEESQRGCLDEQGQLSEESDLEEHQPKVINRIPIIALTAHAMKGDCEKCIEAGMEDYITKPIKREAVFEVIEKWVFKKRFGDTSGMSSNLGTFYCPVYFTVMFFRYWLIAPSYWCVS